MTQPKMKKKKILFNKLYPETTDPHVLYELRDKMEKLGVILVKWNSKKLDANEGMYEIWKLFHDLAMESWKKRKGV